MSGLDTNVVVLNGARYPIKPGGIEQTLTQFPAKEMQGDPKLPDHTLTATVGFGNFAGGWGRLAYQTGGDTDRFWFSSLDTRWPGYLVTLPTVATTTVGGAANYVSFTEGGFALCVRASDGLTYPLWYAGAKFQVAASNFGTSGFGTGWSTPLVTTTLAGGGIVYITDSISFQGGQLWACADTTRAPIAYRYNASDITAAVTTSTSTPLAMKFAVLGENVYMAGHKAGDAKTIYISTSTAPYSSTTWTDVLSFQRDDKDTSLQFFVQGYSAQGLPCFYLGTGRSIFQIDVVRGTAQKIFSFPRAYSSSDKTTFINACVWDKTGNLYVSQGFNLWEIGGSIKDISPFANGDGLPNGVDYSGFAFMSYNCQTCILGLFPRREGLVCVTGNQETGRNALVLEWRGGGWHSLINLSSSANYFGKGIAVNDAVIIRSEATSAGAFTGLAGIYDLDSAAPLFTRGSAQLASSYATGHLMTPLWDGGFPTEYKDLIAGLVLGGPYDNLVVDGLAIPTYSTAIYFLYTPAAVTYPFTANEYQPRFSINSDPGGVAVCRTVLDIQFGPKAGAAVPYGMLRSVSLKYLLRPKQLYGFNVTIDLSFEGMVEGRSADAMKAELKALLDTTALVTFTFNSGSSELTRYVAASAFAAPMTLTPLDPQSTARLTLLEPRPYGGFVQ